MAKTVTISAQLQQTINIPGQPLNLEIRPVDGSGVHRGLPFFLTIPGDYSTVLGPDGTVIESPAPSGISSAATEADLDTALAAAVAAWDTAGKLDSYL